MPQRPPSLPSISRSLPLLAALCAPAVAWSEPLALSSNPRLPAAVAVKPSSNLEIRYRRFAPDEALPGPGRLEGIVSGSRWELRSSVLVEPGTQFTPRTMRLDSGLEVRDAGALRTVVLGDTLTSGGGWSRPVRMGGVRFGRGLALRPGFDLSPQIRTPGVAALPKTGLGFFTPGTGNAQGLSMPGLPSATPGPRMPAVAGPMALGSGASDYEFEVGRLRSGWGTEQDEYGDSYAAGSYRRGLTDRLTAEVRAEWTRLRQASGLELVRSFGPAGLVHAVLAQSAAEGLSGLRWGLGAMRQAMQATWRLSWDAFERDFTPLAAASGEVDPQSRLQAAVNAPVTRSLNAGLSYGRDTSWNASNASVLGLNAQWKLGGGRSLALDLTDRAGDQAARQAKVVFTVPLWRTPGVR